MSGQKHSVCGCRGSGIPIVSLPKQRVVQDCTVFVGAFATGSLFFQGTRTPGEEAEYDEAACAGMEWCDPEGSRTADTA